jgi:glucokinase
MIWLKEDLLIGIAMPGPFDYENGISLMLHGKFLDIYNVNIKEELAKDYRFLRIRFIL